MSEGKTVSRQKALIRALLAKHDPGLLAFMDATRGVFGPSTRLTQLDLPLPDGKAADRRRARKESKR
jgi:hypothetical protein